MLRTSCEQTSRYHLHHAVSRPLRTRRRSSCLERQDCHLLPPPPPPPLMAGHLQCESQRQRRRVRAKPVHPPNLRKRPLTINSHPHPTEFDERDVARSR